MAQLFENAGAYLKSFVSDDWETFNEGGWFLSPTQHLIENLIVLPVSIICIFIGVQVYKYSSSMFPVTYLKHTNKSEKFLAFLLLFSWGMLYLHKLWRNAIPYLLQPCHMLSVISALVFFMPKRWTITHVAALIAIHLQW
eukprot:NODE_68_length_25399_cov_0.885771.p14 type:complete len:140 gc:universal NODE_68_length_25399_cov_0.885771:461-880(+)